MKGRKNLGSVYDRLTPEECFQLVLEAAARQDETEVERLANTCQRYRYTSVRNEPAYSDRIQASRKITICVCLVLMEISAKLMLIRTSQQYVTLLSRSLITEFERGYRRGWEAGCDHVWLSAGMAGPFPWRDNGDLGERADEGQDADEGGDDFSFCLDSGTTARPFGYWCHLVADVDRISARLTSMMLDTTGWD